MIVSVIIPVYNSIRTIETVVHSLLKHDKEDIEVILVDDGSSDGSSRICDYLAERDGRCKVFHKPNAGVSSARNFGINHASGDYIYFCDSDDIVDTNCFLEIIELLKRYSVDVVVADFQYSFLKSNSVSHSSFHLQENTVLKKEDIVNQLLSPLVLKSGLDLAPLWNKFFKRKLILENQVFFEEKVFKGEDWRFIIDYFNVAETAYYYPKVLYTYCIDGSQVESKYKRVAGKHLLGSIQRKLEINRRYNLGADQDKITCWCDSQFNLLVFSAKNGIESMEWAEMCRDWSVVFAANHFISIGLKRFVYYEISRKYYVYAWLIRLHLFSLLRFLIGRD